MTGLPFSCLGGDHSTVMEELVVENMVGGLGADGGASSVWIIVVAQNRLHPGSCEDESE